MTMIPLHFDTTLFAICCFFVALVACTAGLFSSSFRDNWLQHFGMFFVGIASAMKMFQLFERHRTSPETALLAFGVALFAVGVAWKVFLHAREQSHDWQAKDRRKAERRSQH
jgi:uncharacterized membrane protein AbrB (regulator of aidB expression)